MKKPAFSVPKMMRAAICTEYGDAFDDILTVQDIPSPHIDDKPPAGFKNGMLIRVLAVSLAPGDVRVMSGKTKEFQGPPSFPYTPGGDVCGVVVQVPEEKKDGSKCRFRVGDRIAARFANKPMGMIGEYALVNTDVCDIVPDGITPEDAAALVSSGTVAVLLADRIKEGERVLIFGAGGGVGSHLCQLVRNQGASYVVGVGKDPQRLMKEPLNCDYAIDYTKTDPFVDVNEWKEQPFDVIIDLSGGIWPKLVGQKKLKSQRIIKSGSKGGRYLTTTPDSPWFEIHSVWAMMSVFLLPSLRRAVSSRVSRSSLPKYSYVLALPGTSDVVMRTLSLAKENKLVACIDPHGPFSFTADRVRDAFRVQQSRHAKGKVVITVAKE